MFLFCEIKCWRTTFALTTCMIRPFLSASKSVGYSSLKHITAHLDSYTFFNKCFSFSSPPGIVVLLAHLPVLFSPLGDGLPGVVSRAELQQWQQQSQHFHFPHFVFFYKKFIY